MIVLHIGFHKAGSTTIQHYLKDNAERLEDLGFNYPLAGRGRWANAHHMLSAGSKGVEISEEVKLAWAEIRTLAEAGRTVVISSEGFERADPEAVAPHLAGLPVKVVAWIRDLPNRIVSIYTQSTKAGNNRESFDRFFDAEINRPRTPSAGKLAAWADLVGPAQVRVRSLDRSTLEGADLIRDLHAAIGLSAADAARLKPASAQNVSPGWRSIELLRSLTENAEWMDEAEANLRADDPRSVNGAIFGAAIRAETALGWGEKGEYLTQDQIDRACALHNLDMAALRQSGMDVKVADVDPAAYRPRGRLRTVDDIDVADQAAFYREMVKAFALQTYERPWRRHVTGQDKDAALTPEERDERRKLREAREARRGRV